MKIKVEISIIKSRSIITGFDIIKVKYTLLENVAIYGYIIPKGYTTDFATIPQILWSLLPPIGKHNRAALLHDWLYDNKIGSRKKADDLFLKQMEIDGVNLITRYVMYLGVRLFAKPWWKL
jgi:hypothetical protein